MIKKINPGLTLVEIVLFMFIVTVMAGFAIPVYQMIIRNQVLITEERLMSALQFARMQAILRSKNTIVHSDNWNTGLTISFENETHPIRVESFESTTVVLTAFNNQHTLKFYPDGRSMTNGVFDITSKTKDNHKSKIIFQQSGRIRRE